MTTQTFRLDEAAVERVSQRAREVKFSRVMASLLGSVFFFLGWLAAKVFTVSWFVIVWCALATADGWQQGRQASSRAPGA